MKLSNIKIEILIYFLWIISLFLIYQFSNIIDGGNFSEGYKLGNDSSRYINAAKDLLTGNLPSGKANSYFTYNLFLAFCLYINIGLFGSVIIQIILTGIASFCLYRISIDFFSKYVARITLILFLFFPHIQLRNFYVLTESLYISLSIIGIYLICQIKNRDILYGYIVLILASFIRPNSIVLLLIIYLKSFFIFYSLKNKNYIYLFIILSLITLIPVFFIINKLIINENIFNYLISGAIIQEYNGIKVDPIILNTDLYKENSFIQIIIYIYSYPLHFLEVIYKKLYWSLLRYRPFYSDIHNYFILFTTIPIYIFFTIGIF